MLASALVAALLVQAAGPAPALQRTWILKCDVGVANGVNAPALRVFRVGPRLLQEWKPMQKKFGPNLCLSFTCKAADNALEGTISSASLMLTIKLDPQTKGATWQTFGASGLKRTNGPCTVGPDTAGTRGL